MHGIIAFKKIEENIKKYFNNNSLLAQYLISAIFIKIYN